MDLESQKMTKKIVINEKAKKSQEFIETGETDSNLCELLLKDQKV